MKLHNFIFSVILAVCVPSVPAQAQYADAADTIATARVTAGRAPSRTLQATPLQTVSHSEIESRGIQELYEAVRGFAGVNVRDYGGIGGVKTVSIRSLGAQHTAVSYDGIPMSDIQSGQVDIGRFSLDNVETVTLSIGQGDNIFQSARMQSGAGAVEIRTLRPDFSDGRSSRVTGQMKFSSFHTYNPSLLYEQKLGERWTLSLNGDWLTSDGVYPFTIRNGSRVEELMRENSDVKRLRTECNISGRVGRTGELSVKGNWLNSERGLPGAVIFYNPEAAERLWDRDLFTNVSYAASLSEKWRLQANLKYSYAWNRYIDVRERYAGGMLDDRYTQREYSASAVALCQLTGRFSLSVAEDLFENTLSATIPECQYPQRLTSMTALSGQWKDDRLTVTANLLAALTSEKVRTGSPAPDRSHISPAVSLSYKLFRSSSLRLRASFKDGYRIPTFNDLYYARVGNTALLPERARQFNIGLTWSGQYVKASADGYYNSVKDKIVAIPTLFIWKMMNMGRVSIAGCDLSADATVPLGASRLLVSGNWSYQHAVDVTDPEGPTWGHQIPYTPKQSGNAAVCWVSRHINIGYVMNAVGKRYSMAENRPATLVEGYVEHTVSAGRDFTLRGVTLGLKGEIVNLTGRNYCVIQYYPMPGRTFRLSLKIKY